MKQEIIEKLKIAVNQFYLKKYMDKPLMTDREFDLLRYDYEHEYGSVKQLIEWDPGLISEINLPEAPLEKVICEGEFKPDIIHSLESDSVNKPSFYLTYKYDGCGIKAYYRNGVLYKIQSTPDEEYGIIRTKAFWNLFPHKLQDKSITCLRGEVLVDFNVYGQLSRNQANGFTNSQYLEEEVENQCFIRIYKVQYSDSDTYDYDRQKATLDSLPNINLTRTRLVSPDKSESVNDLVFSSAYRFSIDECPTQVFEEELGHKFQIDGVVLYTDSYCKAFKFYYTEFAIIKITNINWGYNDWNGSYIPVAEFEPVILNDKSISRCTCSGVPNMVDLGIGIGAEVKLILSNLTIPKIIEVIKPSSDFNYPKCECGYQLSYSDLYGSVLKCGNQDICKPRYDFFKHKIANLINTQYKDYSLRSIIENNPFLPVEVLGIDRFNPQNKFKGYNNESDKLWFINDMYELILTGDSIDFNNKFLKWYNCSDLQYENARLNFNNVLKAFKDIISEFKITYL